MHTALRKLGKPTFFYYYYSVVIILRRTCQDCKLHLRIFVMVLTVELKLIINEVLS